LRDGTSFATRRVKAIQHGHPIFTLSASFQVLEPGLQHAIPMPPIPSPDDLPSEEEVRRTSIALLPDSVRKYFERERPIELRPVQYERWVSREPQAPVFQVWIRTTGRLPDDPAIHQCALAYASDMTLLDSTLIAHGRSVFEPEIQAASLDHALWFHQPFRADEWLLYSQESPFSGGARGFARGSIFSSDGRLIASVAQEGLIRDRGERKAQQTSKS
jgi:acyl-CoA thioesterase-2